MRTTLSSCRRTSSAPMYTTHSRSSSAAAVAVATPCWPAPVSAMTRRLPMRRASSAWPRTLLILWAPVWQRSSRLRRMVAPQRSLRRSAWNSGVGRPAYSARRRASSAWKAASPARLLVGRRQLVERRDERLRHEAPAVGAEARLDGHSASLLAAAACSAASLSARSTAAKNSRSRGASLMPGTHSTPLETSTAAGCSAAMAAPTRGRLEPSGEDEVLARRGRVGREPLPVEPAAGAAVAAGRRGRRAGRSRRAPRRECRRRR